MKSFNELIKDVERDLVINLTLGIRSKRLSKKEARDTAREFMTGFPFKDKNDFFMKLNKLSEKYRIVRKIYIKHALSYESEKDELILKEIRDYMKLKNYENAIKIAKGGE